METFDNSSSFTAGGCGTCLRGIVSEEIEGLSVLGLLLDEMEEIYEAVRAGRAFSGRTLDGDALSVLTLLLAELNGKAVENGLLFGSEESLVSGLFLLCSISKL